VWDPATTLGEAVDYEAIKAALAELPRRFPPETILVDQSGESAAIMGWAKTHPALSLRVNPSSRRRSRTCGSGPRWRGASMRGRSPASP
jgi:hypothetical protein